MYYKYYLGYIIVLIVLLFLCSIKYFKKKYKNIILLMSIFFLGQRWGAGVDFYGYLNYFISKFKVEFGYTFIQNYLSNNNIYFGLLIFTIYVFITVFSLNIFLKFCNNNISIFIFFISEYYIMSINPLRTYLSLIFFLLICNLIIFKNKNVIIKSIFFLICGYSFHKSIIIIMPMLIFIKHIPYKKIVILTLFILPFINSRLLISYSPYGNYYLGSIYDVGASVLNIIKYYSTLVLYFYMKYTQIRSKKEVENLFIIYLFFYGLSINFAPISRLGYFFKLYEVIYFCQIFNLSNYSFKIIFNKTIVILFFIGIYFGAAYRDLAYISFYRFEPLKLKNIKTYKEYNSDILNYIKILKKRGELK